MIQIFARNYRGFKDLLISLDKTIFLVGDNSTGKSSIIYLMDYIVNSEFNNYPTLNTGSIQDRYDFFSPYFDNSDVTIGFIVEKGNKKTSKIITIKKGKEFDPPTVVRFSLINSNTAITLKKNTKNISIRYKNIKNDEIDVENIYNIHNSNSGFVNTDIKSNNKIINSMATIVDSMYAYDKKRVKT